MKFCGGTPYGSKMFQKKFGNFSSSIDQERALFVKIAKILEKIQNYAKPRVFIGISKIKVF
jgi:hypothetical protein